MPKYIDGVHQTFIGDYGNTKAKMSHDLHIPSPINNLYGEHMVYQGVQWVSVPDGEDLSILKILEEKE